MRDHPVRLSSGTVGSRKYVAAFPAGPLLDIPAFVVTVPRIGLDLMGSQTSAKLLAERLVRAWAAEGHRVDAWTVKLSIKGADERDTKPVWVVRSDLVNGMPSGMGRRAWEAKFGGEF